MSHKDTKGKPKLSLIPYEALVKIAQVREFGVNKYGDDVCWKMVDKIDFADAALRHIFKYMDGKDIDPESGLGHLAHAATSLILAISLDDRVSDDMLNELPEEVIVDKTHEEVWEEAFNSCDMSQDDMSYPVDNKGASDFLNMEYDDSVYHPTHYPRR